MSVPKVIVREEPSRCLMCLDGPCTGACPRGVPVARAIRALRLENLAGADRMLGRGELPCASCDRPCEKACLRTAIDRPVDIAGAFEALRALAPQPDVPASSAPARVARTGGSNAGAPAVDLSVDFCGVHLENPFLLSSSVVASTYEMVARAFDAGWAGAAFKTISSFVPKEVSPRFDQYRKEGLDFLGFKNIEQISDHPLKENLAFLRQLKRDYPSKVLVVSIMGTSEEDWCDLARAAERAGADIIECNFSCPHMAANGLGSDVGTNPELVARYTRATKRGTSLPVLAKMTPNITNMEEPALAAVRAGADGLAAINTIKSITGVNLDDFSSRPDVCGKTSVGGYSGKAVKPIALRFVHDLRSANELACVPVSGMGGIETWRDVVDFMALGCGCVQVTTAVMQYGYRIVEDLAEGLATFLASHGMASPAELVGLALPHIVPADELDRDSVQFPRFVRSRCVGCGRCAVSCADGGHQAIAFDEVTRRPSLIGRSCVGCQLCALVCPVGAIQPGARVAASRLPSREGGAKVPDALPERLAS